MRATTINGQAGFVLDCAPDWSSPVRLDLELGATLEAGLTEREVRRPTSTFLRCKTSFDSVIEGPSARRLVNAFAVYQKQPVAVPLWGFAVKWSPLSAPSVISGMMIAFRDDWSQWELYTSTLPGWVTEADNIAPVLVGGLDRREVRWLTPDVCVLSVSAVESSPASNALSVGSQAFEAGPFPSDAYKAAPRMFPLPVDYNQPAASWSVRVERDQIGFGREPVETLYPQANASGQEADYVAVGSEVVSILRFFQAHAGGQAFWAAENHNAAILTGDIGELAIAAPVDSSEGIAPGDWLALQTGSTFKILAAASATPTGIFFDTPPGFVPAGSMISRAKLVRFARPRISLCWLNGSAVSFSLSLKEVPPEYTPAPGEILGVTLGASWHRCYLYELTSGTEVERLTSHEEDIDLDGVIYSAAKIDHGSINRGLALDRDGVNLKAAFGASALLRSVALLKSNGPVNLVIREASVTRIAQFGDEFGEEFQ